MSSIDSTIATTKFAARRGVAENSLKNISTQKPNARHAPTKQIYVRPWRKAARARAAPAPLPGERPRRDARVRVPRGRRARAVLVRSDCQRRRDLERLQQMRPSSARRRSACRSSALAAGSAKAAGSPPCRRALGAPRARGPRLAALRAISDVAHEATRAGAEPIANHDRRTLIKGDHIIGVKQRFPVPGRHPRSWLTEPMAPAASSCRAEHPTKTTPTTPPCNTNIAADGRT